MEAEKLIEDISDDEQIEAIDEVDGENEVAFDEEEMFEQMRDTVSCLQDQLNRFRRVFNVVRLSVIPLEDFRKFLPSYLTLLRLAQEIELVHCAVLDLKEELAELEEKYYE